MNYSPNFFGDSGDAFFYALATSIPLPAKLRPFGLDLSFVGEIGRQTIDNNGRFGTPYYSEWTAGLAVGVFGFDVKLLYQDTSRSDRQCSNLNNCGARALFSIAKTF